VVPITASSLLLHFLAKAPYAFDIALSLIVRYDVLQTLKSSIINAGELIKADEAEQY
jgi:hypothetical protein